MHVGTFAGLSLRYGVSADAPIAGEFARLYGACRAAADASDAATVIELREEAGAWSIGVAGEPALVTTADRGGALLDVMRTVDELTVRASERDVLVVHASAALFGAGPVLFVGPSGAGKSTIAAALTAAGRTYAGDEAIGIDLAGETVVANPKPFKLDRRSRSALRLASADDPRAELLVAPGELGAAAPPGPLGPPAAVVRVVADPASATGVQPMVPGAVAELLAGQCFNFVGWGARALDAVAAVARAAPGLELVFSDVDAAVAALDRELA